jgi:hypothetical protein
MELAWGRRKPPRTSPTSARARFPRQVTTEKLEAAICAVINAYNKFHLPRYWGDTKRVAADGTQ